MDTRLAILLGASALLVVSIVYFVVSLLRSRRPPMPSGPAAGPAVPDAAAHESLKTPLDLGGWAPEPSGDDAPRETGGVTPAAAPPTVQVAPPASPVEMPPVEVDDLDEAVARLGTIDVSTLIPEPAAPPLPRTAPPAPADAWVAEPEVPSIDDLLDMPVAAAPSAEAVALQIDAVMSASAPAPEPPVTVVPMVPEETVVDAPEVALPLLPEVEEVRIWTPEPELEPVPEAVPELAAAVEPPVPPAPAWTPEPPAPAAPAWTPEPAPVEPPAPAWAPEPSADSAPAWTPEPPVEPAPAWTPEPAVEAAPAPAPEPPAPPAPAWTPEPAPEEPPVPSVPEYRMIAPVELSFFEGGQRVGIKPGTATFLKYQRLAAVLLNDLKQHPRD